MFNSTFEGCSSLNSEIPSDLFAGISGAPNTRMFRRMFYACSKVHGDIPNDLFAGISKTTTATDQMTEVFTGSGLITSCPAGEYQYMTGFESYFGGKVSCTPCPNGYDDGGAGLTAINQCQMTVESGKYIATSGAATVTNCPVNNMCPGGKVNYTDTGIISACPTNSSTNGATGQASCTCNTGYNYNGGTTVTTNACVANTFTVKYNAGLGAGDMVDVVCNYDGGCVAANNAFVMTGYNFVGWLCSGGSCDGKVIQPGASLVNATAENNAVIGHKYLS
jgi:hypothetical protein